MKTKGRKCTADNILDEYNTPSSLTSKQSLTKMLNLRPENQEIRNSVFAVNVMENGSICAQKTNTNTIIKNKWLL